MAQAAQAQQVVVQAEAEPLLPLQQAPQVALRKQRLPPGFWALSAWLDWRYYR